MEKNKFFSAIKNSMFPHYDCPFCGKETIDGKLCKNCKSYLIMPKYCAICGEHVSEIDNLCNECKEQKRYFDASRSVAEYNSVVSKAVQDLKYNAKRYIAEDFAGLLADVFVKTGWNVDYVCAVPSSPMRMKERGFNHSEDIAKSFCKLCNLQYVDLIKKVKETRHQTEISQEERYKNLDDAFKLNDDIDIKNKNILIVDDVFTTGSTLNACAKATRKGKPNKIFCLTIGKTLFESGR